MIKRTKKKDNNSQPKKWRFQIQTSTAHRSLKFLTVKHHSMVRPELQRKKGKKEKGGGGSRIITLEKPKQICPQNTPRYFSVDNAGPRFFFLVPAL